MEIGYDKNILNVLGAFKILVLIHDGETKSYLARHPTFDRAIMLHVLPKPGSAEYASIAAGLEQILPASRKLMLDRGELDGSTYIVTERILDFRSFPAWIEKNSATVTPAAPPALPSAPDPPATSPPGEFTRMFQSATPPAPIAPVPMPQQPAAPPGEFTRMFSGANASAPLPVPNEPKKAGTFTKAFLALSDTNSGMASPIAAPPVAPAPTPSKPGEFTAFFAAPVPTAPDPLTVAPPRPTPPIPTPAPPPFPAPSAPPMPQIAPVKPATPGIGEFTRMFGEPLPAPPQAPAASQAIAPEAAAFGAPAPPAAVPMPAVPAPAPPVGVKAPSNNLILILAAVILVAAAIGLILFFVIKR